MEFGVRILNLNAAWGCSSKNINTSQSTLSKELIHWHGNQSYLPCRCVLMKNRRNSAHLKMLMFCILSHGTVLEDVWTISQVNCVHKVITNTVYPTLAAVIFN